MFKEIGRIVELLKYPQSRILELDKVAHINGDDLTLTITSEESAELIQAISKVKNQQRNRKSNPERRNKKGYRKVWS